MTFPAFSLSRKFFLSLAVAALLHGCSHGEDTETKHRRPDTNSSRFEWAVQHYEAGNYPKAIQSFEALRKDGASVPDFDLLPFYLGMSHFKLGHYEPAAKELESFVRASGAAARQENQDARLALLLTYEKLGRWKEAASLAAETDKLTLFQNNRALLKLVWARALREQGELLGAKAALEEAQPFLDKVSADDGGQPFYADPDQDLWGRYHFTGILVQETECGRLEPKDLAAGKPAAKAALKGKKKPAGKPKRLYSPWLEAVTDCQRKAVDHAAEEIFSRESPWSVPARAALGLGIGAFGEKIAGFLKDEASSLDHHRALQKAARENLYRLLATIEEQLKIFKDRELNGENLEPLRKQVDRLLVQISSP